MTLHSNMLSINVEESREIEKRLMTGVHIVRDLSCAYCQKRVGWKYVDYGPSFYHLIMLLGGHG